MKGEHSLWGSGVVRGTSLAALWIAACTPAFQAKEHEEASGAGGTGAAGVSFAGRAPAGGTPGSAAGAPAGALGNVEHGGGSMSGGPSTAGASAHGHGGTEAGGAQGGSASDGGMEMRGGSATNGGNGGTDGGTGGNGAHGGAEPRGGSAGQSEAGGTASGGAPIGGLGGFGATAGHTAAGAAGTPNTSTLCMPAQVLDDMEDGDHLACANQGRSGDWWSATGTTTGTIDPPTDQDFPAFPLGADARAGSQYGMRLSGQSFGHTDDDWASIGFFIASGAAYDLSGYTGLKFYAKSRAEPLTVHVRLASATTTPSTEGGGCDTDCNDHFGGDAMVTTAWQEFTLPFATLAQEGWGPKTKDLQHTLFVYFGFLGTDGGPATFDYLIDDIRLY
ncbi:MAG TPA: hypothetical protein VGQ57_16995 [Polyangiaceae bacterium]|nr:hypothetical protein [Polyangiaceae bacterium]